MIDELTTTLLELKAARTTVEQVLDGLTLSADPSQGIAAAASSLERLAEQYSKTGWIIDPISARIRVESDPARRRSSVESEASVHHVSLLASETRVRPCDVQPEESTPNVQSTTS